MTTVVQQLEAAPRVARGIRRRTASHRLATAFSVTFTVTAVMLAASHGTVDADMTIASNSAVRNVNAYLETAAWSRRAPDGWHLVIRHDGVVADAPVAASAEPYDPDLGPTRPGRQYVPVIVYARGGDLFRFAIDTATETRLSTLSSPATETAPSFFNGTVAFQRTSGKRKGLYLARPGRRATRLSGSPAVESDLSETRVAGRFGSGDRSLIRVFAFSGGQGHVVARARARQRLASPALSKQRSYWLRVGPTRSRVQTTFNDRVDVVDADRTLPGAQSMALNRIPTFYATPAGIVQINPILVFRSRR